MKKTKLEVQYTGNGTKAEHCSICEHYQPPYRAQYRPEARCEVVQGEIIPGGWCKLFALPRKAA